MFVAPVRFSSEKAVSQPQQAVPQLQSIQPFLCSHQWAKGAAARFNVPGQPADEDTFVLLAPPVANDSPMLKQLEGKIPPGLQPVLVPQRVFDALPKPFHD